MYSKQRCVACYYRKLTNDRQDKLPKHPCACGCGEMIPEKTIRGKPMRFKPSHMNKRELAGNWKGGIRKAGKGYLRIYSPDHPLKCCRNDVLKHRLVYEEHYNCILLPYTEIDHIDGDVNNNHISNLQPFFKGQHSSKHWKLRKGK